MSTSGQPAPFPPVRRLPTAFLSLAPNTSDSYPRAQAKTKAAEPLTADNLAAVEKKIEPVTVGQPALDATKRRTSSLSSDGSKSNFRFLKLGPVHYGEHQDESKGDFFEVAVVE
ncbi:hypothetical protein OQA88_3968 [Cercophora sp. LCS_1]